MEIPEETEIDKQLELLIDLSLASVVVWFILSFVPPQMFWVLLVILSAGWFSWEVKNSWSNKKVIKKAMMVGIILVGLNLLINYRGAIENIYYIASNKSIFFIYRNPVELLLISFFGATAWFIRLGEKTTPLKSSLDILILSVLGTAAELFILKPYGLMNYVNVAWFDPLLTYIMVWSVLHLVYYKGLDPVLEVVERAYAASTQVL